MKKQNKNGKRIHTIVTHVKPHLDEIVGIWLCQRFHWKLWAKGGNTAKIVYWGHAQALPGEQTAEELEQDGNVLIGVCKGLFDEHPSRDGKCAATLVAEYMRVDRYPELEQILRFTLRTDMKGDQPFGLADMVKTLHEANPDNPGCVIDWVFYILDAEYEKQKCFQDSIKEYQEKAEHHIIGINSSPCRVAIIESDSTLINKVSRLKGYGTQRVQNCEILIQKRSSGNVVIFTDNKSGVSLTNVSEVLTVLEPSLWYYHKEGEQLLNGSLTACDIAPTELSLDEILSCIKEAFKVTEMLA